MIRVIFGDEGAGDFVASLVGEPVRYEFSLVQRSAAGDIQACMLYHDRKVHEIGVTLAIAPGAWVSRRFIGLSLHFPFFHLKISRINAMVRKSNVASLHASCDHYGMRQEGFRRMGYPDGEDMVMLGLLPKESRFWRLAEAIEKERG